MFLKGVNLYISNNVLLDLEKMDIYQVDTDTADIIKELYQGNDLEEFKSNENYNFIKTSFFLKNNMTKETAYSLDQVTNLQIKISNTCNLKCKYCYASGGNYNQDDRLMSIEIANRMVEKINRLFPNLTRISFFGGEPLLNIPVIETFVTGIENDIIYSLITNATIVNQKIIDLCQKYNIKIIASLDGPKEINDEYRVFNSGKGTFEQINKNLKKLQNETNALSMISAVYTKMASEKMSKESLYEYFYQNYTIKNIGIGDVLSDDVNIKLPSSLNEISLESIDKDIDFFIKNVSHKQYVPLGTVYDVVTPFLTKRASKFFCGAGIYSMFIDELGNICPCQLFVSDEIHHLGNIFMLEADLKNKVNKVQEFIKINNSKSKVDKCKSCICNFWCFKCIGANKDDIFYGCTKNGCVYYKNITERILEKITKLVADNEFLYLIEGYNQIIDETMELGSRVNII